MAQATVAAKPKRLLTQEQQAKGYWVERPKEGLRVWHGKNNIAFLLMSGDVYAKVQDVVKKRIEQLLDVEAKTGWKAPEVELPDWAEREPNE